MRRRLRLAFAMFTVMVLLAACGGDGDEGGETGGGGTSSGDLTPVSLQLQWFTQAQFAGYFAAAEQGYYEDAGLDVEILEGGTDIVPQTVLAQGQADFAIAWVPKALESREQGALVTDIGQIFQRSGTLQVSFADAGIGSPADLAGRTVGNWGFGNEYELFAAMTEAGLEPGTDVTLVQQQFDMNAFLAGDIDAAQAMSYNEYAQVLEAENPQTGELFQPEDLSVLDWNEVGTAMLQDAVWASSERLESDEEYQETAAKFVEASMRGWIFCRDDPEACVDIVVAAGSTLGASHQLWMMNEINKLVWPSTDGIGMVDQEAWDRTVEIALNTSNAEGQTVLTAEPEGLAFTNDYTEQALEVLTEEGLDVTGDSFEPLEVELEPGGE